MEDVEKHLVKTDWLVPGWIKQGVLTVIAADTSVGKSWFSLWLARSVMTGADWFTGGPGPAKPGNVLWCDTESRYGALVERMNSCGLPKHRMVTLFDSFQKLDLEDPSHFAQMKNRIDRIDAKLVIVDPLCGAHAIDENSAKMGRPLQQLAEVCQTTGVPVSVDHHSRKLGEEREITLQSIRGSSVIAGSSQMVLGIDLPDPNSETRRIRVIKENVGSQPAPIGFTISSNGLTFVQPPLPQHGHGEAAVGLLIRMIPKGGWAEVEPIMVEAKRLNLTTGGAMQTARSKLRITKQHGNMRRGPNGPEWRRP